MVMKGEHAPPRPQTLPPVPTALPQTHTPAVGSLALVFPKISIHHQKRQPGRFRSSKGQVVARGEGKPLPLPGLL